MVEPSNEKHVLMTFNICGKEIANENVEDKNERTKKREEKTTKKACTI